jgi:2,4-dienoyl-CoA reductase-like NADH-dependent reductase (Old Yellow Enzyme family)
MEQAKAWKRITDFAHSQGSKIGIQLWHAGQKGSTTSPWQGQDYVPPESGGWRAVAPSAIPFGKLPAPKALDLEEIKWIINDYRNSAQMALQAGFDVVEIHGAHGYLIHSFLSPLSNTREDNYGGSYDNRTRFLKDVVVAIREVWPATYPLFIRLSTDDWVGGGWRVADSARLASELIALDVDLMDCSSGGVQTGVTYPIGPGYQVPFAREIRATSRILTAAVGMITQADEANRIIESGDADAVMLGRELLRNPNWALNALSTLHEKFGEDVATKWPNQYLNGRPNLNLGW